MLIGLSGAGKSTVAPLVARHLDAPWCDLDREIERAHGATIARLFATRGEAIFRGLEREAMRAALATPPQVIAAGGGWAAWPGNLALAQPLTCVIYLSVAPAEAARRLAGAGDRPLLAGSDVEARLAAQLAERMKWYRLADIEVAVDGVSPEDVATGVVEVARRYGGW